MFQNLSTDELKSLMAALMTPKGYRSNKMSLLLADSPDRQLQETYATIAAEILSVYLEASETLCLELAA